MCYAVDAAHNWQVVVQDGRAIIEEWTHSVTRQGGMQWVVRVDMPLSAAIDIARSLMRHRKAEYAPEADAMEAG